MERQDRTDVDLDGLRVFAQALRSELENGLKPGLARAEREVQQGIPFGVASPGGEVKAGREVLAWLLERARENTTRQVAGIQALAEVAEQIVANYADGEAVANRLLVALEQRLAQPSVPDGSGSVRVAGDQP